MRLLHDAHVETGGDRAVALRRILGVTSHVSEEPVPRNDGSLVARPARVTNRKRIVFAFTIVTVIAAVAVGIVLLTLDTLAAAAVKRSATRALGVETQLASLDIGVIDGTLDLRGLEVANPAGFDDEAFLRLASGHASVEIGSLFGDVVNVRELTLSNLDLWLQQNGTLSNWNTILAHVRDAEAEPRDQAGPKVRVERLLIKDVRATVRAQLPGTPGVQFVVPITSIELAGIGDGESVPVAQLTATVVKAVLGAVLENAGDSLPAPVAAALRAAMAPLRTLEQLGVSVVVQAAPMIREAIEDAARRVLRRVLPGTASGSDVAKRKEDG